MFKTKPPTPESKASLFLKKCTDFFLKVFFFFRDLFYSLRVLLFIVFMLTVVLRFWIGFFEKALGLLRILIRLLTVPLGITSGIPLSVYTTTDEGKSYWKTFYNSFFRELIEHLREIVFTSAYFLYIYWQLSITRKVIVAVIFSLLVFGPLGFVIPRPEVVTIVSVNSIAEKVTNAGAASYLVLAVGEGGPDDYLQFKNEEAWWLGKFNSQKLKTILRPGHKYKIWIVGFRILFPVKIYPNIISAERLSEMTPEEKMAESLKTEKVDPSDEE